MLFLAARRVSAAKSISGPSVVKQFRKSLGRPVEDASDDEDAARVAWLAVTCASSAGLVTRHLPRLSHSRGGRPLPLPGPCPRRRGGARRSPRRLAARFSIEGPIGGARVGALAAVDGRTALVTGANTGLGLETAVNLARAAPAS